MPVTTLEMNSVLWKTCIHMPYIGGYNHFRDKQTFFKIELRPGVSKSDACQTVFNQLNLYYEKH